jgi:hypothetical protein
MCRICWLIWLEQALHDTEEQPALVPVYLAKEMNYRC